MTTDPTPAPDAEPAAAAQPASAPAGRPALPVPENVWLHGLTMLVLVLLVNLAQALTGVVGLIQFLWMLIAKERNAALAEFGEGLGNWLGITARFVAGASDERPFPWTRWR